MALYVIADTIYKGLLLLCFILRAMRLLYKLLEQGYPRERLKSSLRKFYGQYGDHIKQNEVPLSQMLHEILEHVAIYSEIFHWSDITLTRVLRLLSYWTSTDLPIP